MQTLVSMLKWLRMVYGTKYQKLEPKKYPQLIVLWASQRLLTKPQVNLNLNDVLYKHTVDKAEYVDKIKH